MQMICKCSGAGLDAPWLFAATPTLQAFECTGSFTCTASLLSLVAHVETRTRANSHKNQDHPQEGPQERTLASHKRTQLNTPAMLVKQPTPRAYGERMLPACNAKLIN